MTNSETIQHSDGRVELRPEALAEISQSTFYNEDLAPVTSSLRAHSLTTYLHLVDAYAHSIGEGVEDSQWQLVYAPCYYDQLFLPKGRTKKLRFPTNFVAARSIGRCFARTNSLLWRWNTCLPQCWTSRQKTSLE